MSKKKLLPFDGKTTKPLKFYEVQFGNGNSKWVQARSRAPVAAKYPKAKITKLEFGRWMPDPEAIDEVLL